MPPQQMIGLMNPGLGVELIYSFVIIAISFIIYLSTKELYELSSYKGIKYFRNTFLFFGLAFFSRIIIKFAMDILGSGNLFDIRSKFLLGNLGIALFIYFSTLSVLALLYSSAHKYFELKNINFELSYILVGIITLVFIFIRTPGVYLIVNLILLILVSISVYLSRDKASSKGFYIINLLLLVFWILNFIDLLVPNFLRGFQMLIYLASISVFFIILYKVLKRIGD